MCQVMNLSQLKKANSWANSFSGVPLAGIRASSSLLQANLEKQDQGLSDDKKKIYFFLKITLNK